MAVTINADTSNGLVMTPDTSGEIKLQSAGTDVATFASSGISAPTFVPTSSSAPTNGLYIPTTNTISVATDSTERIRIDASGRVTKPYQVGFKAKTGGFTGTANQVISTTNGFSNLSSSGSRDVFNTGSHFSDSTGKFTAPVAGKYLFGYHFMRNSTNGSSHDVRIRKNGANTNAYARGYDASYNSAFQSHNITTIIDLATNDYVEWFLGAGTMYDDDSAFWGYLLG